MTRSNQSRRLNAFVASLLFVVLTLLPGNGITSFGSATTSSLACPPNSSHLLGPGAYTLANCDLSDGFQLRLLGDSLTLTIVNSHLPNATLGGASLVTSGPIRRSTITVQNSTLAGVMLMHASRNVTWAFRNVTFEMQRFHATMTAVSIRNDFQDSSFRVINSTVRGDPDALCDAPIFNITETARIMNSNLQLGPFVEYVYESPGVQRRPYAVRASGTRFSSSRIQIGAPSAQQEPAFTMHVPTQKDVASLLSIDSCILNDTTIDIGDVDFSMGILANPDAIVAMTVANSEINDDSRIIVARSNFSLSWETMNQEDGGVGSIMLDNTALTGASIELSALRVMLKTRWAAGFLRSRSTTLTRSSITLSSSSVTWTLLPDTANETCSNRSNALLFEDSQILQSSVLVEDSTFSGTSLCPAAFAEFFSQQGHDIVSTSITARRSEYTVAVVENTGLAASWAPFGVAAAAFAQSFVASTLLFDSMIVDLSHTILYAATQPARNAGGIVLYAQGGGPTQKSNITVQHSTFRIVGNYSVLPSWTNGAPTLTAMIWHRAPQEVGTSILVHNTSTDAALHPKLPLAVSKVGLFVGQQAKINGSLVFTDCRATLRGRLHTVVVNFEFGSTLGSGASLLFKWGTVTTGALDPAFRSEYGGLGFFQQNAHIRPGASVLFDDVDLNVSASHAHIAIVRGLEFDGSFVVSRIRATLYAYASARLLQLANNLQIGGTGRIHLRDTNVTGIAHNDVTGLIKAQIVSLSTTTLHSGAQLVFERAVVTVAASQFAWLVSVEDSSFTSGSLRIEHVTFNQTEATSVRSSAFSMNATTLQDRSSIAVRHLTSVTPLSVSVGGFGYTALAAAISLEDRVVIRGNSTVLFEDISASVETSVNGAETRGLSILDTDIDASTITLNRCSLTVRADRGSAVGILFQGYTQLRDNAAFEVLSSTISVINAALSTSDGLAPARGIHSTNVTFDHANVTLSASRFDVLGDRAAVGIAFSAGTVNNTLRSSIIQLTDGTRVNVTASDLSPDIVSTPPASDGLLLDADNNAGLMVDSRVVVAGGSRIDLNSTATIMDTTLVSGSLVLKRTVGAPCTVEYSSVLVDDTAGLSARCTRECAALCANKVQFLQSNLTTVGQSTSINVTSSLGQADAVRLSTVDLHHASRVEVEGPAIVLESSRSNANVINWLSGATSATQIGPYVAVSRLARLDVYGSVASRIIYLYGLILIGASTTRVSSMSGPMSIRAGTSSATCIMAHLTAFQGTSQVHVTDLRNALLDAPITYVVLRVHTPVETDSTSHRMVINNLWGLDLRARRWSMIVGADVPLTAPLSITNVEASLRLNASDGVASAFSTHNSVASDVTVTNTSLTVKGGYFAFVNITNVTGKSTIAVTRSTAVDLPGTMSMALVGISNILGGAGNSISFDDVALKSIHAKNRDPLRIGAVESSVENLTIAASRTILNIGDAAITSVSSLFPSGVGSRPTCSISCSFIRLVDDTGTSLMMPWNTANGLEEFCLPRTSTFDSSGSCFTATPTMSSDVVRGARSATASRTAPGSRTTSTSSSPCTTVSATTTGTMNQTRTRHGQSETATQSISHRRSESMSLGRTKSVTRQVSGTPTGMNTMSTSRSLVVTVSVSLSRPGSRTMSRSRPLTISQTASGGRTPSQAQSVTVSLNLPPPVLAVPFPKEVEEAAAAVSSTTALAAAPANPAAAMQVARAMGVLAVLGFCSASGPEGSAPRRNPRELLFPKSLIPPAAIGSSGSFERFHRGAAVVALVCVVLAGCLALAGGALLMSLRPEDNTDTLTDRPDLIKTPAGRLREMMRRARMPGYLMVLVAIILDGLCTAGVVLLGGTTAGDIALGVVALFVVLAGVLVCAKCAGPAADAVARMCGERTGSSQTHRNEEASALMLPDEDGSSGGNHPVNAMLAFVPLDVQDATQSEASKATTAFDDGVEKARSSSLLARVARSPVLRWLLVGHHAWLPDPDADRLQRDSATRQLQHMGAVFSKYRVLVPGIPGSGGAFAAASNFIRIRWLTVEMLATASAACFEGAVFVSCSVSVIGIAAANASMLLLTLLTLPYTVPSKNFLAVLISGLTALGSAFAVAAVHIDLDAPSLTGAERREAADSQDQLTKWSGSCASAAAMVSIASVAITVLRMVLMRGCGIRTEARKATRVERLFTEMRDVDVNLAEPDDRLQLISGRDAAGLDDDHDATTMLADPLLSHHHDVDDDGMDGGEAVSAAAAVDEPLAGVDRPPTTSTFATTPTPQAAAGAPILDEEPGGAADGVDGWRTLTDANARRVYRVGQAAALYDQVESMLRGGVADAPTGGGAAVRRRSGPSTSSPPATLLPAGGGADDPEFDLDALLEPSGPPPPRSGAASLDVDDLL